jgi:hypothetical protein
MGEREGWGLMLLSNAFDELFIAKTDHFWGKYEFQSNFFKVYLKTEYGIGFPLYENLQKHISFKFLP